MNLRKAVLDAFLGRSGGEALVSRIMSWKWKWLTGNEVEFLAKWAGAYTGRRGGGFFRRRNPEKDLKVFLEKLNRDKLDELREFWGLLPVPE